MKRSSEDLSISLSEDGFEFENSNSVCHVRWKEIQEICAYKLDLLTTDEVRFSFRTNENAWIEISEEQPGFEELCAILELRFPAVKGWQQQVIKAAFSENRTVLYVRT